MNILLIDDDTQYGSLIKDHFSGTKHQICFVSNKGQLKDITLRDFSIIIIDHTLEWGKGVDEINRLSSLCTLDFALISTRKDYIFLDENTRNGRITGIFGKFEMDKIDSWVLQSEEKQLILESASK